MGQSVSRWADAVYRNEVLRAERVLAEIRARVSLGDAGDVRLAAQADVHRLVGAVDGVLVLHRPSGRAGCQSCARRRGWPCATVRTVARALGDTR